MKLYILLALTLMSLGSLDAERTKGRNVLILPSSSKLRQKDIEQLLKNQNYYEDEIDEDSLESLESDVPSAVVALEPDSSSGRLFFQKFFGNPSSSSARPQIIVISRPAAPAASTGYNGNTSSKRPLYTIVTGNRTIYPISRGNSYDDDEDDVDDDVFEDEIQNETPNVRKQQQQPTLYRLVKGEGNRQQGLGFVMPSKNNRNFQNNRNTLAVNPSGTFNSGGAGNMKKFRLSTNSGNGKRKRSRSPVRRRFVLKN